MTDGYLDSDDGLSLYFRERVLPGAHAHAVVVHGVSEHYGRYRWVEQRLAQANIGFSMMDLRGHGRSSAPDGEWTVADMGRDIVRLLRQLGAEKANLVGLSLGGMVAQQFALDYPYATASLVLVDTIAGPPPGGDQPLREALAFIEAQPMRAIAETRIAAAFTDAVDPVMRGHVIEQAALNDKDNYLRAARATFSFNVRERLGEIAAPTLVVVGEQDRTFPMAWMEDVASGIRGARLVRLSGAAHISNMERPREFNRAVLDFLGV